MRHRNRLTLALVAAGSAIVTVGGTTAWATGPTGPSTSVPPYLLPDAKGVSVRSILTTGDTVGGYTMAGTPDGLGAFDNGDGTFTLLSNHEFAPGLGAVHAHGGTGAFVSKWVIDKKTLAVRSGADLIQKVFLWNGSGYTEAVGYTYARFCSADLAPISAFYNSRTGKGYRGRIFMNGEENGIVGRAFGHVVATGDSFELASIGRAGWENLAAHPNTGDRTVVIGQSDIAGGRVVVYVGDKRRTGNPVEKAGLVGGTRYAISVDGVPTEDGGVPYGDDAKRFSLTVDAPDNTTGTGFDRPEDGSWDPERPNDYYFATTASMTKQTRLWRLRFDDVRNPTRGGTITKVYEGPLGVDGGTKMIDNLTVTEEGTVLLQEDPGNNAYVAGVWEYDIKKDTIRRILLTDPAQFTVGGASFITQDEETSGIIPAPFLGEDKYLLDVQVHAPNANPALVEGGQYVVLTLPEGKH